MLRRFAAVLLAAVLVSPAHAADKENKLPADAQAVLDKCEAIEILSLDPSVEQDEKQKDRFHGWKVLGKTTAKKDDKQAVVDALGKGIKDNEGLGYKCFEPRHGIKAAHEGQTVELVICFECHNVEVNVGKQGSMVYTTGSPQKTFDKVLTAAKVPLASKSEKK